MKQLSIEELKESRRSLTINSNDLADVLDELIAIREAQGVPVAWRITPREGSLAYVETNPAIIERLGELAFKVEPLFTAPQLPVGFLFVVKATGKIVYSSAAWEIDGAQLIGPIYGNLKLSAAPKPGGE